MDHPSLLQDCDVERDAGGVIKNEQQCWGYLEFVGATVQMQMSPCGHYTGPYKTETRIRTLGVTILT